MKNDQDEESRFKTQCRENIEVLFSDEPGRIIEAMRNLSSFAREESSAQDFDKKKVDVMKDLSVHFMIIYSLQYQAKKDQDTTSSPRSMIYSSYDDVPGPNLFPGVVAGALETMSYLVNGENENSTVVSSLRNANAIKIICESIEGNRDLGLATMEFAFQALDCLVGTSEEHGLMLAVATDAIEGGGFGVLTDMMRIKTYVSTTSLRAWLSLLDNMSRYPSVCKHLIQSDCVAVLLRHSSDQQFATIDGGTQKANNIAQRLFSFALPREDEAKQD